MKISWSRTLAIAALFAIVVACNSEKSPIIVEAPDPPEPLQPGVYPLTGISPTLPSSDLEPLRGIVGDARFVALGESTHTSEGYYQAKARIIRFMIEHMGFRVVTFENPWLQSIPAAQFVASCTGSPSAALAGFYPVWRDATVRDLLRWLCDYNRAHANDPVTFFGFDIQEPWKSAPALQQFVQRAAPAETARAQLLNRCLGATHGSDQFYISQDYRNHVEGRRNTAAHDDCLRTISDMESWISANSAALQSATSAGSVEEARLALIALRAYEQELWVPDPGGFEARDFGMAELLRRLHALHTPGKKTIVWAWNWHIARRYEEVRGFDDDPNRQVPRQGARSMGSFLNEALGSQYLPIALIGYNVGINSGGIQPQIPASPMAVERRLNELGRDYLLVDLRQPLPGTLLPPGPAYQVSQEWGDPYRQFGALLFLKNSAPMTYVPIGG